MTSSKCIKPIIIPISVQKYFLIKSLEVVEEKNSFTSINKFSGRGSSNGSMASNNFDNNGVIVHKRRENTKASEK